MQKEMNCTYCNHPYKVIITQYKLKTRDERRREVTISNLPIYECSVCPHREMPEKSESIIRATKEMIRTGMEQLANEEKRQLAQRQEHTVSGVIRRFIS